MPDSEGPSASGSGGNGRDFTGACPTGSYYIVPRLKDENGRSDGGMVGPQGAL